MKGTLFTVQKALSLMPPGGSIIINGSMVSIMGVAAFGIYAATKAALRSFARTWSVDRKGRGAAGQLQQVKAQTAATTPLGHA